jgi:hypothetical protein
MSRESSCFVGAIVSFGWLLSARRYVESRNWLEVDELRLGVVAGKDDGTRESLLNLDGSNNVVAFN